MNQPVYDLLLDKTNQNNEVNKVDLNTILDSLKSQFKWIKY